MPPSTGPDPRCRAAEHESLDRQRQHLIDILAQLVVRRVRTQRQGTKGSQRATEKS